MKAQNRIEKALHEQTRYLAQQQSLANNKMDQNMRWFIGLMITMIITLIVGVFFQPHL